MVGLVSGVHVLSPEGARCVNFFADVAGVSSRARRDEASRVLERVALSDRADEKVGSYSRGMKQRLHVARALLGRPPLLLLDEPTTGLDPDIALQVRDLIRELAEDGVAILLTSHSMPEVEELATVITVIGAGRVAVRRSLLSVGAVVPPDLITRPASLEEAYLGMADRLVRS